MFLDWLKFKVKERKLTKKLYYFYVVTDYVELDSDFDENVKDVKVYALTNTYEESMLKMGNLIKEKYKEHYQGWCECHNKEVNQLSLLEYLDTCASNYKDFVILKVGYSLRNIATMLNSSVCNV